MRLNELTKYNDVVVQCHDNPDADALASGFVLMWYLKKQGVNSSRFIYSGRAPVTKSNLVLMIEKLGIQVQYVTKLENKPELLVTVDCQYGESNVTKFEADNVAVIDHHQVSGVLPSMSEVRSNYGSCSTVIYKMLLKEGIDINEDENAATAMYYGLMTDTNGFAEISHPSDKDLRDSASFRSADIVLFKNANLSREELKICSEALGDVFYDYDECYGIVEARPCDPNILGIISDMLLEVDFIKTCIAYSVMSFGVKISVRSCVREVKASELASFIAEKMGGGGGHLVKAGGFLKRDMFEKYGICYEEKEISAYIRERMAEYFKTSKIIYAGRYDISGEAYKKYVKKEVKVGYVKATDLASPGNKIMIRTLEGDVDVDVEEDLYIMIGVDGEIYPCKKSKFEVSYKKSDDSYIYPGEYEPEVVDSVSGKRMNVVPFAHTCIATGGMGIYAFELENRVKVFTSWDPDKYYLGVKGDYLAARVDDLSDVYVIAKKVFDKTYVMAEG